MTTTPGDDGPIELTDPRDVAFSRMAQRALVNDTVLPSGFRTPARDLVIEGSTLVEPGDGHPHASRPARAAFR